LITQYAVAAAALAVLVSTSVKSASLPPTPEAIYSHQIPVKLWGVTELRECVFAVDSSDLERIVTGTVSLAGDVEFKFQNGQSVSVRSDETGLTGIAATMVKHSCFLRFEI
jgi:hypothetical protein